MLIPDFLPFKQEKQSFEVRESNANSLNVESQCSVNTIPKESIYSQRIILPPPFSPQTSCFNVPNYSHTE